MRNRPHPKKEAIRAAMRALYEGATASTELLATIGDRTPATIERWAKDEGWEAAIDNPRAARLLRGIDRATERLEQIRFDEDDASLAKARELLRLLGPYELRALESKAMSYGSGQDGGYLVPDETEAEIGKRLTALSPIRSIASVRQVSSAVLKKPFAVGGPATGWVAETAARPQTATPTLAELSFATMELYAMPAATASLLDDAAVDLDQWISAEVEAAFAEQEGLAFVMGDGVNQPHGFLDYPRAAEASWTWGNLGYVATGAAGALPASNPSDVLIDLVYALKAGYRQNAAWVMNRKTQAVIRKIKDADGNYLWAPPASAGGRATLMGFPLVEAEDMPDIATDEAAIAFGDFSRGYLVVDRTGVRVLRDPYSAKPYVLFYITKRVGGGIQDFDAIKLLKFGTA